MGNLYCKPEQVLSSSKDSLYTKVKISRNCQYYVDIHNEELDSV